MGLEARVKDTKENPSFVRVTLTLLTQVKYNRNKLSLSTRNHIPILISTGLPTHVPFCSPVTLSETHRSLCMLPYLLLSFKRLWLCYLMVMAIFAVVIHIGMPCVISMYPDVYSHTDLSMSAISPGQLASFGWMEKPRNNGKIPVKLNRLLFSFR